MIEVSINKDGMVVDKETGKPVNAVLDEDGPKTIAHEWNEEKTAMKKIRERALEQGNVDFFLRGEDLKVFLGGNRPPEVYLVVQFFKSK